MKELISTLENNIFSGVLIKKGKNLIEDAVYNKLTKNKQFIKFLEKKHINLAAVSAKTTDKKETDTKETETDFTTLSYDDLKKYVKENNIEVKSMKKEDILAALTAKEDKE